MKEVRAHNITIDSDYKWPFGGFKFLLFLSFLFSLAIVLSLPFKKISDHVLASTLHSSAKCNLSYNDYNFSVFLPKINFDKVSVPAGCVSKNQQTLPLEKLSLGFGGINFSPLGVVANLGLKMNTTEFTVKASSNSKDHVIKIDDQKIDLPTLTVLLKKLADFDLSLEGMAKVNLDAQIKKNKLKAFNLDIESKNFLLPQQSIMGFAIPDMDLQRLKVKAQGKDSKILVEELNLGDDDSSPLYLMAKGEILANYSSFSNSNMDLELDLFIGEEVKDEFAMADMLLGQFKNSKGEYKLKLDGRLSSPKTSKR